MENRTDVAEYRIVDRHGVPKYQIHLESGGVVEYSPTELTALLLQSLKQDAERYLGEEVKQAFVAVPDGFSDIERVFFQSVTFGVWPSHLTLLRALSRTPGK
jgi:molecular chaperone DnaK (HSP70)